jgi:hypothetical protein
VELLDDLNGIQKISVNTVTGSTVINYDQGKLRSDEILQVLKENMLFDASKVIRSGKDLDDAVSKAGGVIGRAIFGWAVGKAFEGSSLSILAAFI